MDGNQHHNVPSRFFSNDDKTSLKEFHELCFQKIVPQQSPLASYTKGAKIPIYELPTQFPPPEQLNALQNEWNHVLLSGPGVFVVKNLYKDLSLIDRVNQIYALIIASEKESSTGVKGDHFSTGLNSRIWNSFSKHCLADPSSFVSYYSNPYLAAICEAWLGPMYKITAQVNIVHPGGKPQVAHRDYHLGFQSTEAIERFPKAMQVASQFLTLQGAVAHTDMPVESGPTRLLPFSQTFEGGYLAFRTKEFQDYFLKHHISLPLKKGDGLFFNPALMHAAGENTTDDFSRSANLLQISSAFGKPMEMVDTLPLVERCWEHLVTMYKADGLSAEVEALIVAIAEGYPFPTNLDRIPPKPDGMCPESEQEVLVRMLNEGAGKEVMLEEVRRMREDGRT
jgi:ectoine hydroxylase-related dioxygenase (phytanoyl-CoA dioxygenase family)